MCRDIDAVPPGRDEKRRHTQWICRDFSQVLDAQEIGAGRVKNRSIQVIYREFKKCQA